MKITFDILDSEADLIAEHNGYDAAKHGTKAAFILEVFKQSGRVSIIAEEGRKASIILDQQKKDIVESKKSSISF